MCIGDKNGKEKILSPRRGSSTNDGLDKAPSYYLDGIRNPTTCFDILTKLNEDIEFASESWITDFAQKGLGIDVLIDLLTEKLAKERYQCIFYYYVF